MDITQRAHGSPGIQFLFNLCPLRAPWIDDLDGDNNYDIIYSSVKYQDIKFDPEQPLGLCIGRHNTHTLIKKPVGWGSFIGGYYDGRFNALST
ncbi:MAG: hypothetical protein ABIR18_05240 [Chitinophagaceae bacterium]